MLKNYFYWFLIPCFGCIPTLGLDLETFDDSGICFRTEQEEKNKTVNSLIHDHEKCPDGFKFDKSVIAGKLCIKTVTYFELRNTTYCCGGYFNDSNVCLPFCNPQCLHGTCIAPNVCSCEKGFSGLFCESADDAEVADVAEVAEFDRFDIEKYVMMTLIVILLILLLGSCVLIHHYKNQQNRGVQVKESYWSLQKDANGNMVPVEKVYIKNANENLTKARTEIRNESDYEEIIVKPTTSIGYIEMSSSKVNVNPTEISSKNFYDSPL